MNWWFCLYHLYTMSILEFGMYPTLLDLLCLYFYLRYAKMAPWLWRNRTRDTVKVRRRSTMFRQRYAAVTSASIRILIPGVWRDVAVVTVFTTHRNRAAMDIMSFRYQKDLLKCMSSQKFRSLLCIVNVVVCPMFSMFIRSTRSFNVCCNKPWTVHLNVKHFYQYFITYTVNGIISELTHPSKGAELWKNCFFQ